VQRLVQKIGQRHRDLRGLAGVRATVCGSGSAFHASRWPDDGGFHHDLPPEACFSRRRTPRLQGGSPARASHLLCAAERERRRGQELSCSSPLRSCFWRDRRVFQVTWR